METRLLLPGTEDETDKSEPGLERFVKVEVKTARSVDGLSRGEADLTPLPEDVAPDDIIELEFENDGKRWKQWTTVGQLREDLAKGGKTVVTRDGAAGLFVPAAWESTEATRFGVGTIALKALKVFGIDTPQKFAEKTAQKAAAAIAAHFEALIENQGHSFGLYRLNDPQKIDPRSSITDAKNLDGAGPYLIFIHGTASSSVGSFGKLADTDEWKQLVKQYSEKNILALEHRTFSVSPIQNALDLAKLLPAGARLHLVSHSRGGLVGELMCLAQAGDCRAKFDDLTRAFAQKNGDDKELKAERERQRQLLAELWDTLLKKKIVIERFARVACPAHGTTLASKRMDLLASGTLNAIGLIPGIKGNPALEIGYDWLKSLLLTLVKEKASPRDLPGIEAMIPDSPLIEFLNHQDLVTEADLCAIAGDIEVGNLKLSIPALIGNAFFWAKNDLVVNTKAMYDGIRRKDKAYYFFAQGSNVCHFNYFLNDDTRGKLKEWLLRADGVPANFSVVSREMSFTRGGDLTVSEWLEKEELVATAATAVEAGRDYSLQVSVAHGNLRYASYPVAVGHYHGDSIVSAEKALDQALQGRLSQRFQAGIYPGADGTADVIHANDCDPPGALVIGLGGVGELTLEKLRDGVARAALRHALMTLDAPADENRTPGGWRSAAFSSLLLGSYGGTALGVEAAVSAILQGALQANRSLQAQELWDRVRIDKVEVVELYEDMAIQAIRAACNLADHPPTEMAGKETIEVARRGLISKEGGRFQRPANQYVSGWWRRLQITGELTDGAVASINSINQSDTIKGLRFLALTDRARAEDTAQATQRRLVDNLVVEAVQKSGYDERLGLTLFELLVPNSLKTQTNAQSDLMLVVDRDAAQYPWELLAERSGAEARPLALSKGMIRQFKTADFRPNPQTAHDRNVLVVGDTENNISPLPGAKREAEEVAIALGNHYGSDRVTTLIQKKALEIVNGLFARDYNIIHLAGHGIYDPGDPAQSGMALSDGLCLSTAEFQQLRIVPDLVFINCCHLGRIDKLPEQAKTDLTSTLAGVLIKLGLVKLNAPAVSLAEKLINMGLAAGGDSAKLTAHIAQDLLATGMPESKEPDKLAARLVQELIRLRVVQNAHNKLAASVSEELIRMGVKAVVAAGWAVNDEAATTFAKSFYEGMIAGESFGVAAHEARKAVATLHPQTNTWGAYQCYGNPEFRLAPSQSAGSKSAQSNSFLSRREYLDELRSMVASAKNADGQWRVKLGEQLANMRREILPEWLDGQILSAFAAVWAELGYFEMGIEYYELALHAENGSVSLRDIEQLANLESRYARRLLGGKRTQAVERKARRLFGKSNERLEQLLKFGKTSERLSLLAGNHKRLAQITAGTKQTGELKAARDTYWKSHELALRATGEVDYYPALNWAACSLLADGASDRKSKDQITEVIRESKKVALKRNQAANSFWDRNAEADADLLQHLVDGDLTSAANQKKIVASYRRVLTTGGTQREVGSVIDQLNFLIAIREPAKVAGKQKQETDALLRIRAEIEKVAAATDQIHS